jgi:hypothetical protein
MSDRRTTLLWMKDLIDHMNRCHDQLQWAPDGPTSTYLTESLLVDLTECRRLCEQLQVASPRSRRGRGDRSLAASA